MWRMNMPRPIPLSQSGRRKRRWGAVESLEPRELMAFDPTPIEQAYLERINHMRMDPVAELQVLFSSTNPLVARDATVQSTMNYFRVDSNLLLSQWSALTPTDPLAWNESLTEAAEFHDEQMRLADQQEHNLPGEPTLGERVRNAGYVNFNRVGENIYAYAEGFIHGHAGFVIDWGEGPGGIQSPPGHRDNIMSPTFVEVGIDVISERDFRTSVGPYLVTQDFGRPRALGDRFILGVVWNDVNRNQIYDPGEGIKDATITITGPQATIQTTSMTAGGYQVRVPDGTYDVTVTSSLLPETIVISNVVMEGANRKIDFNPSAANLKPVAEPDEFSVLAGVPATLDILSNDFDPDGFLDGTSIAVTNQGTYGTVTVDIDNGTVTYTPLGSSVVPDTFSYTVRDNEGQISNVAEVRLTFDSSNQPPVALSDRMVVPGGTSRLLDVLANDTDMNDDRDALLPRLVNLPTQGTVTVVGNQLQYLPSAGFLGVDRMTYQAVDPSGANSLPVEVAVYVTSLAAPWQNPVDPLDVDGDEEVAPLDALLVINHLGVDLTQTELPASLSGGPFPFVDVLGNGEVTPLGALSIINQLGSGTARPPASSTLVFPLPGRPVLNSDGDLDRRDNALAAMFA